MYGYIRTCSGLKKEKKKRKEKKKETRSVDFRVVNFSVCSTLGTGRGKRKETGKSWPPRNEGDQRTVIVYLSSVMRYKSILLRTKTRE